ncbi:MAG TPA: sigma-70 family RNA polymerase sigma factor [Pyrinomonadaceae bacterium]|jgi:RNA polymerase sigma-70 factor|nr:sigma-70 family RNA polymerase sigma factor [Pyrinomonadaceae bacterium]
MSQQKASNTDELLRDGAARLLARAGDARSLTAAQLLPRLRASLDKYLLRHQPDAAAPEIEKFIDALHADELVLVLACEGGDETAWNDLMTRFRSTVLSAARGASSGEAEAEELAQSVWAELYGLRARADGKPSGKLAYYSGCGSLGGWLRAVVGQLAIDQHRRTSRLVQTEEAADFDRMANEEHQGEDGFRVATAPDPERAFAEGEAARAVHAALARAIGELDAEDRLLVKLYYFDDLRLREAGAVLGVHEATASRRLARAQGEIRKRVEALLVASHGWTREEVARTLRDVGVHLQSDLQSILTPSAETVLEEKQE